MFLEIFGNLFYLALKLRDKSRLCDSDSTVGGKIKQFWHFFIQNKCNSHQAKNENREDYKNNHNYAISNLANLLISMFSPTFPTVSSTKFWIVFVSSLTQDWESSAISALYLLIFPSIT